MASTGMSSKFMLSSLNAFPSAAKQTFAGLQTASCLPPQMVSGDTFWRGDSLRQLRGQVSLLIQEQECGYAQRILAQQLHAPLRSGCVVHHHVVKGPC